MATTMQSSSQQVTESKHLWRIMAIGMLAVRFVQGWIYWGGGSRRFIYGPQKINPAGHWMAYKFQTAMPGAILGTSHLISFLLHHFVLLYAGVIIFSAVELVSGLMLISGFLTRLAALLTLGLSFTLMLLFGWQGATCIDEWTMAASNFGMGIALFLVGGGAYSIDNWLLKTKPALATKGWFRWLGGSEPLPLSDLAFKKLALTLFWIAVIFIVATYSYYRGSVITPFHGDPTGVKVHHVQMRNLQIAPDGSVTVHMYVNAGTASVPAHIISARLLNYAGKVVEIWDGKQLSHLAAKEIDNDYAYQQIRPDPILGLKAGLGAAATVHLPVSDSSGFLGTSAGPYQLQILTINGKTMSVSGQIEG
ncbi:quinol oxidase [Acidithiobacillus sp. CV18-2]|uniref:Quinol oxidase n=1 Tax=Igneacidithiobacillus copahuensis TaxID=2724909 RepID=A0AAE2YSL9_9PROT|nr:TQO small subunit DoxD [Igneacidithiobacillus copahuensis]MBU2754210.1 quinol oxidase [Acidithiobacillus sp. CV18-3]MBU2756045.1 quinol oxidase [Acidithiobacillus sp. BN09-2]MBU2776313.1 quinol oxidase [Acidithiobacillus sp. CV18-2]MBU2797665.1 quinol oxidase [Acidithiobacillus sp. VAN18-2]MBU2799222.1 quinol oxidase [Acidithiobacillus sp. VAN18-4]UTV82246.1 quinol oxidase [Acidithiobacillus sp. YTS05]